MKGNELEVGKQFFFIKYNPELKFHGGPFNLDNYEVLKGRLMEIKTGSILMQTDAYGLVELADTLLFEQEQDAKAYKTHLAFLN